MKRNVLIVLLAILIPPIILSSYYAPQEDEHIVIGWNDLGMHCSNLDFDSIVILPPFNNFRAQVIKVGNATQNPEIINTGLSITYEIPGNTYSVGKTNFWDYEDLLFGVNLPDNIGLTGEGMTGLMYAGSDHYYVDGVPITPFTDNDLNNEDPYQLALLKLFDQNNTLLATTQNVMPVSNEIGCVSSSCHSDQWDILDEHSDDMGFDPTDLPILCANCHADVALGMPGVDGVESLSYVIHEKHKDKTNDCYQCHPGENTQCFRGTMHDSGMTCVSCHGDMEEVSESIEQGRRPWLDEPSCGTTNCHGSNYAEEPGKLFKDSKGHGGLYCSACHGSPHAILPSTEPRDNVQNIALQGYAGTLDNCATCHGFVPNGPGPHGITAPGPSDDAALSDLSVDGSTIDGFASQVLAYIYQVPEGTTKIPLINAIANDENATVTITPATEIPGTTEVLVLAEDDATSLTYTVDFVFETVQHILLEEHFQTGIPSDYFSGKLYLESGTWYGKYVKRQESGYSGQAIKLKKEIHSFLRSPKVSSAGLLTFYYKGDEDNAYFFKVQKKAPGDRWVTLDKVYYTDNSWNQYSKEVNDPTNNLKIRIIKSKSQKSNLLIDEFTLTSYLPSTSLSGNDGENDHQLSEKSLLFNDKDTTSDKVKIYAHLKQVYIQINQDENIIGSIEIYDLSGKKLHSEKLIQGDLNAINVIQQSGLYIVNVIVNGESYSEKVFVR